MKKIFLISSLFLIGSLVYAQNGVSEDTINDAVKLYEEGKYPQAMDAFIEILHYGNEEQKNLANEYINSISYEANKKDSKTDNEFEKELASNEDSPSAGDLQETDDLPATAEAETEVTTPSVDTEKEIPPQTKEPAEIIKKESFFTKPKKIAIYSPPAKVVPEKISAEDAGAPRKEISPEELPVLDKELMTASINTSIAKRRQQILTALAGYPCADIRMLGDLPDFIVINPEGIFSETINFRHDTWFLLSYIAGLMYTLRDARFTILPQGIFSGDSSLLDIRRAMAINTVLLNEGISKSRVKVETSPLAISYPEKFAGADGIIISFSYDKIYALKKLADIKEDDKPEITLGVYPNAINPVRERGAILEFAVIETKAPIKDWKLELMSTGKDGKLNLIELAKGTTPAFHQIYWNGKRGFTGPFYPAGKYVCSLSASDMSGGEVALVKSFTVVLSGRLSPQAAAKKIVSTGKYEIFFENESIDIEEDQLEKIEKIIETLVEDENSKILITGFGYFKEPDHTSYALRRANTIKRMLTDEYGISSQRIDISSDVSETRPLVRVNIIKSK